MDIEDDNDNDNDKFSYILEGNNPDKVQEYFWYYFKLSVNNFVSIYPSCSSVVKYMRLTSRNLNKLQLEKKYLEIEKTIQQAIFHYSWYLFYNKPIDFIHLFYTNIKRWNRICNPEFRVEIISVLNLDNNINISSEEKRIIKLNNQALIFIYIIVKMKYNRGPICDLIGNIKINNYDLNMENMYQILDISIENNYTSYVDIIKNQIDIYEYINNKYNCRFTAPISVKKMIKEMKKLNII